MLTNNVIPYYVYGMTEKDLSWFDPNKEAPSFVEAPEFKCTPEEAFDIISSEKGRILFDNAYKNPPASEVAYSSALDAVNGIKFNVLYYVPSPRADELFDLIQHAELLGDYDLFCMSIRDAVYPASTRNFESWNENIERTIFLPPDVEPTEQQRLTALTAFKTTFNKESFDEVVDEFSDIKKCNSSLMAKFNYYLELLQKPEDQEHREDANYFVNRAMRSRDVELLHMAADFAYCSTANDGNFRWHRKLSEIESGQLKPGLRLV